MIIWVCYRYISLVSFQILFRIVLMPNDTIQYDKIFENELYLVGYGPIHRTDILGEHWQHLVALNNPSP